MIKREELLGKGYTEEQVTELLDLFHTNQNNLNKQVQDLQSELDDSKNKIAGLTKVQNEYNQFKQSQMTEQEKFDLKIKEQEAKQKEIETNLANSRRILNTAKAKEMFSEIGGISEDVLNAIVSDDETKTMANAIALLNQIKSVKETTVNQTKESMASLDITPTPSNVLDGQNDKMTWEKFQGLSDEEQSKFADEHPEEFNNL